MVLFAVAGAGFIVVRKASSDCVSRIVSGIGMSDTQQGRTARRRWAANTTAPKYGRVMTYGTQNATVCIESSDVLCNAFSLTRSVSLACAHLLPCSRSVQTATMFWGILGYMFVRHFLFWFGFPKTDEHSMRPTSYRGYSSPCVHLCMYPYPCSTLSVVVCVLFRSTVQHRHRLEVTGRILFRLFDDVVPRMTQHFRVLHNWTGTLDPRGNNSTARVTWNATIFPRTCGGSFVVLSRDKS